MVSLEDSYITHFCSCVDEKERMQYRDSVQCFDTLYITSHEL